jgi:hypothetical protein
LLARQPARLSLPHCSSSSSSSSSVRFLFSNFQQPQFSRKPVNATPEHRTSRRKHRETRAKWLKELEEEEEGTLRVLLVSP